VSGVGHEVDVTIADFVADERAPTPSAAAERVVPDRAEWLRSIEATARRLALAMRRRLGDAGQARLALERRLARVHPGAVLRQHAQRLDELDARLRLTMRRRLQRDAARHRTAQALLLRASPLLRVGALRLRLEAATSRVSGAARGRVGEGRRRMELALRTLHAVSPLATLERGYAIVADSGGHVLRDARALRPGERVTARLARGGFTAEVIERLPDAPGPGEPP
jgi:exodeoxyribonuclease VII large subunit